MKTEQTKKIEENKEIVRRFNYEAFNEGNLDVVYELLTDDAVIHDPMSTVEGSGPEAAREFIQMYRSAFPDAHMEIEHIIAEGDLVAFHWIATGTHEGELMGIEPTGNEVEVVGFEIDRIEDGKIAEGWALYDVFGMMQQLGVIEAPVQ